jgi:hypothetical protein
VDELVVVDAEHDEVGGGGGASVCPWGDVADFAAFHGAVAAGEGAAVVPGFDGAADVHRNVAGRLPDIEWLAF